MVEVSTDVFGQPGYDPVDGPAHLGSSLAGFPFAAPSP